jgi:hypothetical protein
VIGSTTSWTWLTPAGEGAQAGGDLLAAPRSGATGSSVARRPHPARAAGQLDQHGHGALHLGRVAAHLAARLVDSGQQRPGSCSTSLANHEYHAFHASTWGSVMRSMRGPIEPIISGGPPGRGPRGSSSQSRAW